MNIEEYMQMLGQNAKAAAAEVARASTGQKNAALLAIADKFMAQAAEIEKVNATDLENGKNNGLDAALLDRLTLDLPKIEGMAEGLRQIAALPDPVGEISEMNYRPSGIQVGKMRVPLGVIGIIYESRPNVTADAAALCLKSGNATILRGGSEAIHSNTILAKIIREGLAEVGLPENAVQVIETTDRAAVGAMLTMDNLVDVIIPRGGKSLVERVSREASVPVIKHLDGICHVYIEAEADVDKAVDIAFNAKTRRYGVCNAMETLLVDKMQAEVILPMLADKYIAKGVELRGCDRTQVILGDKVTAATEEDWDTEYLAPVLSIRVVDDMHAAIAHINTHSSQHTDSIVTENYTKARQFLTAVDSASVMVNASTAFADGFEYGLGAEIGISTDKLHVRGPVGLEGLTTQKFIVFGDGHIR